VFCPKRLEFLKFKDPKLNFKINQFLKLNKPFEAYLLFISVNKSNISRSFCKDDELSMFNVDMFPKLLNSVLFFDSDMITDVSFLTIYNCKNVDFTKRLPYHSHKKLQQTSLIFFGKLKYLVALCEMFVKVAPSKTHKNFDVSFQKFARFRSLIEKYLLLLTLRKYLKPVSLQTTWRICTYDSYIFFENFSFKIFFI
jgi:hypothetical protein